LPFEVVPPQAARPTADSLKLVDVVAGSLSAPTQTQRTVCTISALARSKAGDANLLLEPSQIQDGVDAAVVPASAPARPADAAAESLQAGSKAFVARATDAVAPGGSVQDPHAVATASDGSIGTETKIVEADPSGPLTEDFDAWAERADQADAARHDREAVAAQAAAAFLRRMAKVGPGTPLEEVAKAWPGLPTPAARRSVPRMSKHRQCSPEPADADSTGSRRVRFNLSACTVHEIIPYGEIYGLHPREFVFDRNLEKVPAVGHFGFVGQAPSNAELDFMMDDTSDEERGQ